MEEGYTTKKRLKTYFYSRTIMRLHDADRKLQIKLTELQMKVQRKTSEYSTSVTFALSSMVVMAFTLYTWAITQNDMSYLYAGVVVAFCFSFLSLGLNRYYSKQLDKLEQEIQELRKQYVW